MSSITKKMAEVARECGFAEFTDTNDFHSYSYASAASIIRMVNRALTDRGVAVESRPELLRWETVEDGGKTKVRAVVLESLTFRDEKSDEVHESGGLGEGYDSGDKAVMKASTAAYKYALAHALVMAWGAEDPEADSKTDKETSKKPTKARAPQKKSTKKRPSARAKGKNKEEDPDSVLEAISSASGLGELEKDIKPRVLALKEHSRYDEVKAAYIQRRNDTQE